MEGTKPIELTPFVLLEVAQGYCPRLYVEHDERVYCALCRGIATAMREAVHLQLQQLAEALAGQPAANVVRNVRLEPIPILVRLDPAMAQRAWQAEMINLLGIRNRKENRVNIIDQTHPVIACATEWAKWRFEAKSAVGMAHQTEVHGLYHVQLFIYNHAPIEVAEVVYSKEGVQPYVIGLLGNQA